MGTLTSAAYRAAWGRGRRRAIRSSSSRLLEFQVERGRSGSVDNRHSALTEHRDRNFIRVAESDDGRAMGFIAAGEEREGRPDFQAEVHAIHVLQEFQGRGCGRALMLRSAERLLREGTRSMLLWVLVENPSRGFYERLGGRRLEQKQITIEGDSLTEVAYGWADLHDLLALRPSAGPS